MASYLLSTMYSSDVIIGSHEIKIMCITNYGLTTLLIIRSTVYVAGKFGGSSRKPKGEV